MNVSFIKTSVGILKVSESDGYLTGLSFCDNESIENDEKVGEVSRFAENVAREIDEYASGKRKNFDIPIRFCATAFQEAVWNELLKIPYGKTATYGEIAERISKPKAQRAVGAACNKNPIAVIVPCHRVVGKSGALVGYAYGLKIKEKLLEIESDSGLICENRTKYNWLK